LHRLTIALAEAQHLLGACVHGHGITAVLAVAPQSKGVTQLVQGGGLQRQGCLGGADQHLHLRLGLPALIPLHHEQRQ